ncbi:FGGY family carbohydrate kinase [Klebsiella variicola]|nr:FGGY family carbohydrate kinase [Klebsiella variicola]
MARKNVAALAISNQRETAIGWYRDSGEPINAAITWQCTRSAAFCDKLRHDRQEQHIKRATGLLNRPAVLGLQNALAAGCDCRWPPARRTR